MTFLGLFFGVWGLSLLITEFDGPFMLFSRFRESLLPGVKPINPTHQIDLMDKDAIVNYSVNLQNYNLAYDDWLNFVDYPNFPKTLKGTLYGIFNCKFCILPYLTLLVLCGYYAFEIGIMFEYHINYLYLIQEFYVYFLSIVGLGVFLHKCISKTF